jgi:peptidoglycan/xylan/chitin deacetylase (PgdA/CDA1 family)
MVAATAATMRRSLVLVFHRVFREGETSGGVVPAVSAATFRSQLDELLDIGHIVPLEAIDRSDHARGRPRFAITLDDDYRSHHDVALPILEAAGVPATFFLAGRSLHGLGPHWFEILDRALLSAGPSPVARELGFREEASAATIAELCERDIHMQQRIVDAWSDGGERHLTPHEIGSLSAAGMAIGFHTLHHPTLVGLPLEEVRSSLMDGRAELEGLLGGPMTQFAYPHGKGNPAIATAVREAGFHAAWTGRPEPVTRTSDPYLRGRWEPGPLLGHAFAARVLARLGRVGV